MTESTQIAVNAKIHIFGDTHGLYEYKKIFALDYNQDDIIIICGDFGLLWCDEMDKREKEAIKNIKELKATLLFVDGNHENFHRINKLKKVEKYGSLVGEYIPNKAYHLIRGNVYNIYDRHFLVMGGALSIDKNHRIKDVSWWSGEKISQNDINNAMQNILNSPKIDYVLTHTCPRVAFNRGMKGVAPYKIYDENMDILEKILGKLIESQKFPRVWFFGHFHDDIIFSTESIIFCCSYDEVRLLDVSTDEITSQELPIVRY